ncbi:MAG TPA: hypothetical protein ENN09_04740 [Planctomycetes bacterium]|nr:hypothetical protein [Planctomycetota bacterium]
MSGRNSIMLMFLIGFAFIFVVTGGMAIYYNQLIERSSVEGGEPGMREQYENARQERITEDQNLLKLLNDIEEVKKQLKARQDEYREKDVVLASLTSNLATYKTIDEINASRVKAQRSKRSDIESFLERGDPMDRETTSYVKEGLTQERNRRDATFGEERSRQQAQIDDLRSQIAREQESATRRLDELRSVRSEKETRLNQARDELRKFTARERQSADIVPNGRVIKTDYDTKIAIIDIGSASGVGRGFRFEVFQIRSGVHREHKGFLEVKTVNPQTAQCIMIERNIELPRCPVCGYTAKMPEEMYCPYCSGGTSGIGVQRLNASPKKAIMGINEDNPIATGDYIWNPLFGGSRGKIVTYKGDPLLPNRFSRPYIEDTIRSYGNRLMEEITAETELLVAGRLATIPVEEARELGIPIVYEFELFPFLRR